HPRRAAELVEAVRDASGLPVGLYCQGAGGAALAAALEAVRAGADLIATAVYPLALTLHRVSGEAVARALTWLDFDTGVDVDLLWRAAELVRIRAEAGWPPLAAPIGQILASQALIHVLSASRYQTVVDELRVLLGGGFGSPPAEIDETVLRAVRLVTGDEPAPQPEIDL